MSQQKRRRHCKVDSMEAPDGFHYEGTPCKIYQGRPTRRLRRDIEGPREEIYADLFCKAISREGEKTRVSFHCCVGGCKHPVVSMFVASAGSVVFQNFAKHLAAHREDCLRFVSAAKRELARSRRFFPPTASSTTVTIQTMLSTKKQSRSALTTKPRLGKRFLNSYK